MTDVHTHLRRQVDGAVASYQEGDDVDLSGLAGSMAVFVGSAVAVAAGLRARGHTYPERYSAGDLLLGGVAVHKLSRLLTKASVTSPLRAPFTTF